MLSEPAINFKTLKDIFKKADKKTRQVYKKEMQEYFEAIDTGLIKPGDPIQKALLISSLFDDDDQPESKTSA